MHIYEYGYSLRVSCSVAWFICMDSWLVSVFLPSCVAAIFKRFKYYLVFRRVLIIRLLVTAAAAVAS